MDGINGISDFIGDNIDDAASTSAASQPLEPEDQAINPFGRLPSYIVAADNHQVANGDTSLMDSFVKDIKMGAGGAAGAVLGAELGSVVPGVGTGIGAVAGAIIGSVTGYTDGKFTAAAAMSGISSFANTGIAIMNMFEDDASQRNEIDVHDWMKAYDDDLPRYYDDNKTAIDISGDLAASMIPGMAGIKIYNYGSKALDVAMLGKIGKNMEGATGLLGGRQAYYLAQAEAAAKETAGVYNYLNRNFIAATLAGAGEQAIQGAVFSAAAAATMFEGPILNDMDYKDIASNIMHGALFAGGVGGVIEGVIAKYGISRVLSQKEKDLFELSHINEFKGQDSWQRIAGYAHSADNINAVTPEQLTVLKAQYGELPASIKDKNLNRIQDKIRAEIKGISSDETISNLFADNALQDFSFTGIMKSVFGLKEVTRITDDAHVSLKEYSAIRSKINKGVKIDELSEVEQKVLNNTAISYFRIRGEQLGKVSDDMAPADLGIVDYLKKGDKVKMTEKGLSIGNRSWNFANKGGFSSLLETPDANEARRLWLHFRKPIAEDSTILEHDLPLLAKAIKDSANKAANDILKFKIKGTDGAVITNLTKSQLFDLYQQKVAEVTKWHQGAALAGKSKIDEVTKAEKIREALKNTNLKIPSEFIEVSKGRMSDQELARLTNQTIGRLKGSTVNDANPIADFFAAETHAANYAERIKAKMGDKIAINPDQILLQPSVIKLVHDGAVLQDLNQFTNDGLTYLRQKEVLWKQEANVALQQTMEPRFLQQLPEDSDALIRSAQGQGVGMKIAASANGEFGSVESFFQRVGKVTNMMKTDVANKVTDKFATYRNNLTEKMSDWMELSAIESKITSTRERYILDETGENLILKGKQDYLDAINAGKKAKPYVPLVPEADEVIPVTSELVRRFLKDHIEMNGTREGNSSVVMKSMHGKVNSRDPRVLYFPQRDPKDYPFKAFVVDKSVSATGHMSMIHAKDAATLQKMIDKIPTGTGFEVIREPITVRTKPEVERWHKAIGDFRREETLGDNYIDTAMVRTGAGASYLPYSDPIKLLDDISNWHKDKEAQLIRDQISLKYAKTFSELRTMDEHHTDIANSRLGFASLSKYAAENVEGPYSGYIRTALDIPNIEAIPARAFQGWLDNKVSQAWNEIANATSKTSSHEQMDKINSMMNSFGIKPFDYDTATQALANHTIDKGVLSAFSRRGNSLLAAISLSLDSLTGVVNTVGSLVLTLPELASITNAIKNNPKALGELGDILYSKVPGTEKQMLTPAKLMGAAIKDFWNPEIRKMAQDKGFASRHLEEVMGAYEHFALPEVYTASDLNSKLNKGYAATMKLLDKGASIFQTKLMEEFQRVTAMAMMKRITDVAVNNGHMSPALADTYINTFVNRVQGNYLASQRPGVFHGPVGQAVGLFQTYNFNFMQQMFRHIGNGDKKSAAMMMGLQGSIFGASGLPMFQAINTHLVGNAEGNVNHNDIYKATYNAVPKEAADWAMYGALSNVFGLFDPGLKMNLYTRGDINPRHLSIIPTSFEDIPIVSASARFVGNLMDTAGKIAGGGDVVQSVLQGLEHNALNRPLSGLAVALEGLTNPDHLSYSTSNAGNLIQANDLYSVTNLARIAGAKPLDEARSADFDFRNVVYQAKDKADINRLGEIIKSKVIGNQQLDEDEVNKFAAQYLHHGGKQEGFAKFMMGIMKSANTAQANLLVRQLKGYDAQTMQNMLGGELVDFNNVNQ